MIGCPYTCAVTRAYSDEKIETILHVLAYTRNDAFLCKFCSVHPIKHYYVDCIQICNPLISLSLSHCISLVSRVHVI